MTAPKKTKNLAIIPARSGSKGLKDKNILDLCGKPLIQYSIDAAVESGVFAEVMVSTDSKSYSEIALKAGASVPFLRSDMTAGDSAGSWDVVAEVLECYRRLGLTFDTVCLLQPTSPLRSANDIIGAYKLFSKTNELPVVSVCETEHSPLWCARLSEEGRIQGFVEGGDMNRRQDVERFFRINGAIYIIGTERFERCGFSYKEGCYAYIMDQKDSVDIDTALDFKIANVLLHEKKLIN